MKSLSIIALLILSLVSVKAQNVPPGYTLVATSSIINAPVTYIAFSRDTVGTGNITMSDSVKLTGTYEIGRYFIVNAISPGMVYTFSINYISGMPVKQLLQVDKALKGDSNYVTYTTRLVAGTVFTGGVKLKSGKGTSSYNMGYWARFIHP